MRKLIIAILSLSSFLPGQTVTPPFNGSGGSGGPTSHGLVATFNGGGSALTAGTTLYLTVPFACTISTANIAVDTGTATVKLWKIASGTAVPTVSNSISTNGFSLASGTAVHITSMTDLSTTAVAAYDIIGFNLFAVSGTTYLNFVAQCDQQP